MSPFDSTKHHRRSVRLKGYDYSQAGAFFITICTQDRACVLGRIDDSAVELSVLGEIVSRNWEDLPARFPNVQLDAFVVMPNHIHGVIALTQPVGATLAVAPNWAGAAPGAGASPAPTGKRRPRLGDVVGTFKSLCVHEWLHRIREIHLDAIGKFWQRNYYEHIVRNEKDLSRIREYIAANPSKWSSDRENPSVDRQATRTYRDEDIWFSRCLSDD